MNKQQLANKIWASANKMRSKIDANEYKDYILGLVFYKFLSDYEVDCLRRIGWNDDDMTALVEDYEDPEATMMIAYCKNNIGYLLNINTCSVLGCYPTLISVWQTLVPR